MTKDQLIDGIRKYNTSAEPEFLERFDENALEQYLQHLEGAARHDIRIRSWIRPEAKLRMAS